MNTHQSRSLSVRAVIAQAAAPLEDRNTTRRCEKTCGAMRNWLTNREEGLHVPKRTEMEESQPTSLSPISRQSMATHALMDLTDSLGDWADANAIVPTKRHCRRGCDGA